ncbi:facilitated trehalose transporter Tret1-like [Planococcus citri]|uniref:facilitated trehalose transporter Tret1-like n=1 Tax=Planococcus citri TaxID=170843 RepID=UPI0031F77F4C
MLQKIPMNGTTKQICFALITLLIYVSIGVSRSYVAFLFHQLDQPDSKLHLTNDEKTWIGSGVGLLTPVGSLVSGYLMDVIGRRSCILLMFVPFLFSWTLVSVASSYGMLFSAMIISSIALGMGSSIIPYVSEISTAKHRGILLALVDTTLNLGVILCSLLMVFLRWNIVSIIFGCMSVVSLLLTLMLPESPVWLYSKGKKEQAIEILEALRSKNRSELNDEIKDMENSYDSSDKKGGGLADTLKKCFRAWRQFSIAILIFLLIILAGPLIFLSYTVLIIDELKTPYDGAKLAVIYSIAGFCGSFLTPFFIHNFKRRVVLIISGGGMAISMLGISLYEIFYLDANNENKPFVWIIPVFLCTFNLLNNMGVFPLGLVIGGELFPLEVRGTLQGFFGFTISAAWAISLKFYPLVMFNFGIRTMLWCFTLFSGLLVFYAIFILPETYGKTLNEVQEQYFSKNKNKSKDDMKI